MNSLNFRAILEKGPEPLKGAHEWFKVILWDDHALKEFKDHYRRGSVTHTDLSLAKMLQESLTGKDPDQFGMFGQIDYTKPFVLIDIVGDVLGTCGTKQCLRVQETPTMSNSFLDPTRKIWDLVIFPECSELADEMTRLHSLGVKTTVAIWNCVVDRYPEPWMDGNDKVVGEILLKPTGEEDKVLSVIIFYQEAVAEANAPPDLVRDSEGAGFFRSYFNKNTQEDYYGDTQEDHLAYFTLKSSQRPEVAAGVPEYEGNSAAGVPTTKQEADSEDDDDDDDDDDPSGTESDGFVLDSRPASPASSCASVDLLEDLNTEIRKMATKMVALGKESRASGMK